MNKYSLRQKIHEVFFYFSVLSYMIGNYKRSSFLGMLTWICGHKLKQKHLEVETENISTQMEDRVSLSN